MKTPLDEYINDIRIDINFVYLFSFIKNFIYPACEQIDDRKLEFADHIYDVVDQLISKYEESFRTGK